MDTNVISRFLSACEQDSILLEFAKNRQISLLFGLTDANLEFYLIFANGEVKTGLGAPPTNANLTLRMTADTFDGVMTGKINAASAAMSGRMRFSGDTNRGMALQRIMKDMNRLYIQARNEGSGIKE
jgi:putative sterol carrier protein